MDSWKQWGKRKPVHGFLETVGGKGCPYAGSWELFANRRIGCIHGCSLVQLICEGEHGKFTRTSVP